MEYIDAKKIRSEVERVKESECASPILVCDDILTFIEYLQDEQPEVDLEKEIDDYVNNHFSEGYDGILISDANSTELNLLDVSAIARHFFELGLKARKED